MTEQLSEEDLRHINQHLAEERYRLQREHDTGDGNGWLSTVAGREALGDALIAYAAHHWESPDSFGNVYCHYCGTLQHIGGPWQHESDCPHLRARAMLSDTANAPD